MSISPDFTPLESTIGGLLIGLSSIMLLLLNGKIAGISGIIKGGFAHKKNDFGWRLMFLVGLIVGGFIINLLLPTSPLYNYSLKPIPTVIAGVLVGFGTYLGNGCTSGHGVCGLSRRSKRSLIATISFMTAGFITMYLLRHL